jgi:outer membrane biosynthesis protein TonB
MRKLIMIAAIALASTTANAGPSRSLSLASADANQPVTEQPKTQAAEPAKTVERAQPGAPQETAKEPATANKPSEIVKPKRRQVSTEARIIYELHRHGIYW